MSYEWHGRHPYKGRYWAYSREKMDQMHAEGRIYFPKKPDGVPSYKRYLDEMPGVPLQDLWTDLDPIGASAAERLESIWICVRFYCRLIYHNRCPIQ